MFKTIENKQELIEQLKNNLGKEIVIHYVCSNCGDEQVTNANTVEEETVNKLVAGENQIIIGLPCTTCNTSTVLLEVEEISGIETI